MKQIQSPILGKPKKAISENYNKQAELFLFYFLNKIFDN